jgi:large subunit ribosomal protein L30
MTSAYEFHVPPLLLLGEGSHKRTVEAVRALGLRRLHQTVVRPDNPQMRGMVFAIQHLVRVEEVE